MTKGSEKVVKKKKEDPSDNKDEWPKKRNSLTDASSTSSSSNSSETSSLVSSTDSDDSSGSEKNKGTMTIDDERSSSQNQRGEAASASATIEVQPMGNKSAPIKMVTKDSPLKLGSHARFRPIDDSEMLVDGPNGPSYETVRKVVSNIQKPMVGPTTSNGTSGSYSLVSSFNAKKKVPGGAKNKERKPTKKERRREELAAGQFATNGLKTVGDRYDYKRNREQVNMLMHEQAYDAPPDDDEEIVVGNMKMKATNNAARKMIGPDPVDLPMIGKKGDHPMLQQLPTMAAIDDGVQLKFVDAVAIGRKQYRNTIDHLSYTGMHDAEKLRQRVGFGIAASGLYDLGVEVLTSQPTYPKQDTYMGLAKGFNDEWKAGFLMTLDRDMSMPKLSYENMNAYMIASIKEIVDAEKNPWMRNMFVAIVDPDPKMFWKCVVNFGNVLKNTTRDPERRRFFNKISDANLTAFVVDRVLTRLTDEANGFTALQYLASFEMRDGCLEQPHCFRNRHRCCLLLKSLLAALPTQDRRKHMRAAECGLSPLHFAALFGAPCQIDALLKMGAWVDKKTKDNRTPLVLASKRASPLMAKQLMWHGADLGAIDTKIGLASEMNPEFIQSVTGDDLQIFLKSFKYIKRRADALATSMRSYVEMFLSAAVNDSMHAKVVLKDCVSDLHMCRLGGSIEDTYTHAGHAFREVDLHMEIPLAKGNPYPILLLVALPVVYQLADRDMAPEFPYFVRKQLIRNEAEVKRMLDENRISSRSDVEKDARLKDICAGIKRANVILNPRLSLLDSKYDAPFPLCSFFEVEHNSGLYAYPLPARKHWKDARTPMTWKFMFDVDTHLVNESSFQNAHVMIQVFSLGSHAPK